MNSRTEEGKNHQERGGGQKEGDRGFLPRWAFFFFLESLGQITCICVFCELLSHFAGTGKKRQDCGISLLRPEYQVFIKRHRYLKYEEGLSLGTKHVFINEKFSYWKLDMCFSRVFVLQCFVCNWTKAFEINLHYFVLSCCLSTGGRGVCLWLIIFPHY